jgi:hypothetical protein
MLLPSTEVPVASRTLGVDTDDGQYSTFPIHPAGNTSDLPNEVINWASPINWSQADKADRGGVVGVERASHRGRPAACPHLGR